MIKRRCDGARSLTPGLPREYRIERVYGCIRRPEDLSKSPMFSNAFTHFVLCGVLAALAWPADVKAGSGPRSPTALGAIQGNGCPRDFREAKRYAETDVADFRKRNRSATLPMLQDEVRKKYAKCPEAARGLYFRALRQALEGEPPQLLRRRE
jgi:hypothetical protein